METDKYRLLNGNGTTILPRHDLYYEHKEGH
jgi:hypothetical protein